MTNLKTDLQASFTAALPIVLGYVAIGVPCGILCDSIGAQCAAGVRHVRAVLLGRGPVHDSQYVARRRAYRVYYRERVVREHAPDALLGRVCPHCIGVRKRLAFLFAATVTDESYGVNTLKFEEGGWSVRRALFVNLFSCTSWTLSCTVGVLVGNAIGIPLAIASFAMTSIFICLLCTQKANVENVVAAAVAMLGVYVFKLVGLTGPAILLGAVAGVVAALCVSQVRLARSRESAAYEARIEEACVGGEGASKKGGERE